MANNVGLYWKNVLRRKLSTIAYPITVHRYDIAPTECPGAFSSDSHEYDLEADTAYHLDNPSAPFCRNGIVGDIVSEEVVGFYLSELKQSQMIEMQIGTLDENEAVALFDGYVGLDNIVAIEYPIGVYHQFEFKRDISVGTEIIAQYGKVRKSNGVL
jgi:hypothetical protein